MVYNLNFRSRKGAILKISSIFALLAFAVFVVKFALPVLAVHTASVSVDQEFVASSSTDPYEFTIANNGPDSVFKITINAPAGFSINTSSIVCPTDWAKDPSSSSSKAVCLTDVFGPSVLTSGNSKQVVFDATSPSPAGDTEYSWSVVTKDANAGAESTSTDATTTVDVEAPDSSVTSPEGNVWLNSNFETTITDVDASSGVASCEYRVYNAGDAVPGFSSRDCNTGPTITVGPDGVCNVEGVNKCILNIRATDNVGKIGSALQGREFDIDFTAPTTTDDAPGGWSAGDVTVALSCNDSGSDCDDTLFCVDETNSCVPSSSGTSVIVTDEGTNYVRYFSVDNAGNTESTKSVSVMIDETNPVVGTVIVTPNSAGFTGPTPTVSAEITDVPSGVFDCQYTIDGGTNWLDADWDADTGICSKQLGPFSEGTTLTFNIMGIDFAGNTDTGDAVQGTVDALAPTVTVADLIDSNGDSVDEWFGNGVLTATADVEDDTSGVSSVVFTIVNGENSASCDGLFEQGDEFFGTWSCDIDTIDKALPDGNYEFLVGVTDDAENSQENSVFFFDLDNTAPTTTKSIGAPSYCTEFDEFDECVGNSYVTTDTTVTLSTFDDGIGDEEMVDVCYSIYSINGGEPVCQGAWSESSFDIFFNEESEHTLEFWSVDALGNEEDHHVQTHFVDDSEPVTTKTYGEPYVCSESDGDECVGSEYITTATEITLTAEDCGDSTTPESCVNHPVGVDMTNYRVYLCDDVGGEFLSYEGSFKISEESCHIIEYYSVDNLGNVEDVNWQQVFVDVTSPVVAKAIGQPKFGIQLTTSNTDGTSEWTNELSHSGDSLIKMTTPTTTDQGRGILSFTGTLDNIESFSYWSNTANAGIYDQLSIWTAIYLDGNDDGVFNVDDDYYLQCEPYYTYGNPELNVWEQYDVMNTKCVGMESPDLPHEAPTLADYISGDAVSFETTGHGLQSFASREYGSLEVLHIDMRAGYGSPWAGFVGYIDDIEINGNTFPDDSIYVTQDTLIGLSCSDQDPHPVGDETIYYRYNVDGGEFTEWVEYENSFSFLEDSAHVLEYYCLDALGNTGEVQSETDIVETVAPVTTKAVGQPSSADGFWVTTNTPITLTAEDQDPHPVGVDYINYEIWWDANGDGVIDAEELDELDNVVASNPISTNTVDYSTVTFSFGEESLHELRWYAVDLLGSQEVMQTQQHNVDNTLPEASINTVEETGAGVTFDSYYFRGTVNVLGTADDNKCFVEYTLDATELDLNEYVFVQQIVSSVDEVNDDILATWDTTTIDDGPYTLELNAQDCSLNDNTASSSELFIDNSAPTSTMTSDETVVTGANDVQAEFSVSWSSIDEGSGTASYALYVKNGENAWVAWTPDEDLTVEGSANYLGTIGHTYCFKSIATDNLGSVEADKEVGDDGVSCTNVVAYSFNLALIQGWNLVSLPVVPIDKDAEDVVSDISDNLKSVWTYDPTDPDAIDGWLTYNPDEPEASNLEKMSAGSGFWIEMDNVDDLTVEGSIMAPGVTPPQRTLIPGWNLIGYYGVDDEIEYPACDPDDPLTVNNPVCGYGKEANCALYSLKNTQTDLPRWTSLWTYYGGSFHQVFNFERLDPGAGYWLAMGSDLPEVMYTMSDCPVTVT
ncbi:MAG: hypothetical protein HYT70_03495 [Candidatus Aenigmarchaeota archaeon]|nr:hypothetical protein [Candidatus Aenigmarchaeota archaeon]